MIHGEHNPPSSYTPIPLADPTNDWNELQAAMRSVEMKLEELKAMHMKQYVAQIQECHRLAVEWSKAHPKANPKIQFNYPQNVFVAAPIQTAIATHLVSFNDEGRELLTHMGAFRADREQPTIAMLRTALEVMGELEQMEEGSAPLESECPYCHAKHDRIQPAGNEPAVPEPGDANFCASCGKVSIFTDDLKVRLPTKEEHQSHNENEELTKLRIAWVTAKSRGGSAGQRY